MKLCHMYFSTVLMLLPDSAMLAQLLCAITLHCMRAFRDDGHDSTYSAARTHGTVLTPRLKSECVCGASPRSRRVISHIDAGNR
jgi:hypothetical protein